MKVSRNPDLGVASRLTGSGQVIGIYAIARWVGVGDRSDCACKSRIGRVD